MRSPRGGIVLGALLAVVGCNARPPARTLPPSAFATTLDTLVPALLANAAVPGAQVALFEQGAAPYARGFGVADRETRRPMTDTTPIGVASVSKAVTSWGALRLAETGVLPLDSPITAGLTRWHLPPSRFDPAQVTARRILSHTAGLGMLSVPCFPADSARPSLEAVLDGRAGDRGGVAITMAPGARWSYSGGGYTLLQLAIEERTHEPFPAAMRRVLFAPLGLRHTDFDPPSGAVPEAIGYDEAGRRVRPQRCVGAAAASLITTARDMHALLAEYAAARAGHAAVLGASSAALQATPIVAAELVVDGKTLDLGGARMALGHFVHRRPDGSVLLFHSGGNPGVRAYLLVDPSRERGLFVAVNSDNAAPVIEGILRAWGAHYRSELPKLF